MLIFWLGVCILHCSVHIPADELGQVSRRDNDIPLQLLLLLLLLLLHFKSANISSLYRPFKGAGKGPADHWTCSYSNYLSCPGAHSRLPFRRTRAKPNLKR